MLENVNNFLTEIIDEDIKNGLSERIHTRFPPEPNGYLHIGSAKAIFINWSIAKKYNGLFNLRYDDTNPVKEDTEYVDSIWEDIKWLTGEEPSGGVYYGSDYFETCFELWLRQVPRKVANAHRRPRPARNGGSREGCDALLAGYGLRWFPCGYGIQPGQE